MLFRKHLINVYSFIGKKPPDELYKEIKKRQEKMFYTEPWGLVNAKVDGKMTNYFEWIAAGHYSLKDEFSTMHMNNPSLISDVYFGFDEENLYLRLDPAGGKDSLKNLQSIKIFLHLLIPVKKTILLGDESAVKVCTKDFIEVSCPFKTLEIVENRNLRFYLECEDIEGKLLRIPFLSYIEFPIRTMDLDKIYWSA
jgi:hypothetical protein